MPRALSLSSVSLLVALCGWLGACSTNHTAAPIQTLDKQCSEPRPQVCTMEYDPVCATLAGGGQREYSSPCNACAHDVVRSYLPGVCPDA